MQSLPLSLISVLAMRLPLICSKTLLALADIGAAQRVKDALQPITKHLQANYRLVNGIRQLEGLIAREAKV